MLPYGTIWDHKGYHMVPYGTVRPSDRPTVRHGIQLFAILFLYLNSKCCWHDFYLRYLLNKVYNFRVILTCSHVWMTHWLIGAPELITCVLHCSATLAKQYKREWKIMQIATKSATKGNHYFTTGMFIFLLAISTSQSWHWIRGLEPQQCIARHKFWCQHTTTRARALCNTPTIILVAICPGQRWSATRGT